MGVNRLRRNASHKASSGEDSRLAGGYAQAQLLLVLNRHGGKSERARIEDRVVRKFIDEELVLASR